MAGFYGIAIQIREVKECNKRGSFLIHGQHHGGATPGLIADVAEDAELLLLVLAGLDTQLQAEIPLEYHLADIARRCLRIGARRDAAAEIPRPNPEHLQKKSPTDWEGTVEEWDVERKRLLNDEWWPRFKRHAMLVVANRNVHIHQGSCLAGKRGKTGCRFNAPWGHDTNATRCVQIFCDVTDVLGSEHIRFRCSNCHAEGALNDMTLTLEEKNCKLAEEDNRRDLTLLQAPRQGPRWEIHERSTLT
jgi:hypothetical protein